MGDRDQPRPGEGAADGPEYGRLFRSDGVKICHPGDLGHALDNGEAEAVGSIDILLTLTGGIYALDAAKEFSKGTSSRGL